jgi:hypothetical protein
MTPSSRLATSSQRSVAEQVGDVLAAIGGGLEEIEDLLPLDHRDRISVFLIEQFDNRVLVHAVGFVFKLADARGELQHTRALVERADRLGHAVERVTDDVGKPAGAGTDRRDLVKLHHGRGRIDGVHHVVELTGQRVDVFAVERGDKGAIEVVDDGACRLVARVLDLLDRDDLGHVRRWASQHLLQEPRSLADLLGQLNEFREKLWILRYQTERHVTPTPPRCRGPQTVGWYPI